MGLGQTETGTNSDEKQKSQDNQKAFANLCQILTVQISTELKGLNEKRRRFTVSRYSDGRHANPVTPCLAVQFEPKIDFKWEHFEPLDMNHMPTILTSYPSPWV